MKNNQATIESKNNHLVRRCGFYHRYDIPTDPRALGQLWPLVNSRSNFLHPRKKSTGYTTDNRGRRKRVHDDPTSPTGGCWPTGVLSAEEEAELAVYKVSFDPLHLACEITRLQQRLTTAAVNQTRDLQNQVNAKQHFPASSALNTPDPLTPNFAGTIP